MAMAVFSADADTNRLLEIVAWNLVRFFGYSEQQASALVQAFYSGRSSRWGDDDYHHEGAFRSAAIMHYAGSNGGSLEGFHEWLRDEGYLKTPAEAQEYFREHYFDRR
jgi:hypothetical protein